MNYVLTAFCYGYRPYIRIGTYVDTGTQGLLKCCMLADELLKHKFSS